MNMKYCSVESIRITVNRINVNVSLRISRCSQNLFYYIFLALDLVVLKFDDILNIDSFFFFFIYLIGTGVALIKVVPSGPHKAGRRSF